LQRFFSGKNNIKFVCDAWHKYSAMNLITITGSESKGESEFMKTSKGTIEFRHLGGTANLEKVVQWCNLLLCVFQHGVNTPFDSLCATVRAVRNRKKYFELRNKVFGVHEALIPGTYMHRFPTTGLSFARKCLIPFDSKEGLIIASQQATENSGLAEMVAKRFKPEVEAEQKRQAARKAAFVSLGEAAGKVEKMKKPKTVTLTPGGISSDEGPEWGIPIFDDSND